MGRRNYILLAALLTTISVTRVCGQTKDSILVGTIHVSKYTQEDRIGIDETSKARVAQFPGGYVALKKFIKRNRQAFLSDRFKFHKDYVLVNVEVDTLGKLSDPRFVHWPSRKYKDEALRIISLMPAWEPALNHDGKKIPSTVKVTVPFPGYILWKK